jgi:hypothetical protein
MINTNNHVTILITRDEKLALFRQLDDLFCKVGTGYSYNGSEIAKDYPKVFALYQLLETGEDQT